MRAPELAVLGGTPAFAEPLHVGRPNVPDRERLMHRIGGVIDSRWLTNDAPLVREFELRIARFIGVRHCVATSSGTTGLEIAIRACGLQGEVIVTPFTFVATAHALQWQGLTPRFCDVDPATHNLDPIRAEAMITPQTTAIVGVHLWGRPCAVAELEALAMRHDLTLLFDAAHAFGCSHGERMIGTFGRAEVLSFHATKFVNTFEGGAIVTDDDDLAARARLMRNFGFVDLDEVVELGTNGKMNEVSAAMGLTSLESLNGFYAANLRNHEAYRRGLGTIEGLSLLAFEPGARSNRHYVVVEVDESAGLGRDELQRVLCAEGVLARRYFYPGCHRLEPYRSQPAQAELALPETERLAGRLLQLPTGTAIDVGEIDTICAVVRQAMACRDRIRRRLSATG